VQEIVNWCRRAGAVSAAALAVLAGLLLVVVSTAGAAEPTMHFASRLQVHAICLRVVDPQGRPRELYGRLYTDGPAESVRPAIVLVHGTTSSTEDWDVSPRWSVARALANTGYDVVSYDRLGFSRSSYFNVPGGGRTLTLSAQRHMLHTVVGRVRRGAYDAAVHGSCTHPGARAGVPHSRIVIIGHSSGGTVVAGYPGEYHDVSAMVQADIATPLASDLGAGGGFTPSPAHPDYFIFFKTAVDCREFNGYGPGVVSYALNDACTPPFFLTPFGEIQSLTHDLSADAQDVDRIGPSIPILLTSGENDTTDPPSLALKTFAYYRTHCRCHVSELLLPKTGHLFMVHRSLPIWIHHMTAWLAHNGLVGHPLSHAG
jgi:pimeloyl-ACP methyl ester carboxylesterase